MDEDWIKRTSWDLETNWNDFYVRGMNRNPERLQRFMEYDAAYAMPLEMLKQAVETLEQSGNLMPYWAYESAKNDIISPAERWAMRGRSRILG